MVRQFEWRDYSPDQAGLVDFWLDEEAVRATGLDDGFDAFYQYWEKESDPEKGEYFRCKVVSARQRPVAVVAFGYRDQTVTVMEIVVDPALRGQGVGAAAIRQLTDDAAEWFGLPVSAFEAVIFKDNAASRNAFYQAGFVRDAKDGERWGRQAESSEILYRCTAEVLPRTPDHPIRWLEPDERRLFNAHLRLSLQKPISGKRWSSILNADISYCGLFTEDKMVARACIEKLTDRYWEISDVHVAPAYRNCGYATALCGFVANEIWENGRIPTIRTEKDNAAMRKVIRKLGFQPFHEEDQ
ncbi:MAG: GNAT family N-acetyltransferase [Clostridia bacterium]|nr:GNAT family N-acetyltransferase [Clostridia bacterium]